MIITLELIIHMHECFWLTCLHRTRVLSDATIPSCTGYWRAVGEAIRRSLAGRCRLLLQLLFGCCLAGRFLYADTWVMHLGVLLVVH